MNDFFLHFLKIGFLPCEEEIMNHPNIALKDSGIIHKCTHSQSINFLYMLIAVGDILLSFA
jgi:hypothetical protein